MDPLLINVVDPGDNPEVGAPMSVLAPQDPEALQLPRPGSPPYYDYDYEGMPRPYPSFYDFMLEPMAPNSPMRQLREYELVNPQELPSTRQNSMDSNSSGDRSQDSQDSGSQNSTSDISENERLDDLAEEPEGMLGIEPGPDLQSYLGRPPPNRLRRQWTTNDCSTLMIPGPAVDDDECSINSFDTYTAEWDKTQTPSSTTTPTVASYRPMTGKRGSDGDIDLDRGEGPSRRQAAARRSSVSYMPYKRQRFSQ